VTKTRNAIFYGTLERVDGDFKLESKSLRNVLKTLPGLECALQPFGDASQYDISERGITFISKDPQTNSATLPTSKVYFVLIPHVTDEELPEPQELTVP
jgi:hypothetical protein